MQDAPGVNCRCGDADDRTDRDRRCSTCGAALTWVAYDDGAVVRECPECSRGRSG